MDNDLSRILEERKRERCPKQVISRLEQETRTAPRISLSMWLASSTALLLIIAAFSRPDPNQEQVQLEAKLQKRAAQERVIQTTYASLAFIGKAILRTTEKTQKILLPESLIPSRDGIIDTKKTIPEEEYENQD